MTSPRRSSLVLGLGCAVTAVSSAAPVILLAQPLPPSVIAGGRVLVTGVVLVLLGRGALGSALRTLRQAPVRGRVLLAAALLALHFGTWVASLTLTSVARSVALVATQPLFAGLLGRLVGDRAPWSLWGGAALALVGTAVMVGGDGRGFGGFGLGDGLALLAAAAASGYLVIGRSVRDHLPLRPYLGLVHLLAAAMLLAVALVVEPEPWPAAATGLDLLALVYLGLGPGVVGHGLLNWAVRHVPVHVVSLVILLEPLGATLLTLALVGGGVEPAEAIGAGVLLLGVALGIPRRSLA
ncbi:MAG: DMT family transporter [Myxococcales bacterium]|nr:DMT family transporter [Myxococcales bacterium]